MSFSLVSCRHLAFISKRVWTQWVGRDSHSLSLNAFFFANQDKIHSLTWEPSSFLFLKEGEEGRLLWCSWTTDGLKAFLFFLLSWMSFCYALVYDGSQCKKKSLRLRRDLPLVCLHLLSCFSIFSVHSRNDISSKKFPHSGYLLMLFKVFYAYSLLRLLTHAIQGILRLLQTLASDVERNQRSQVKEKKSVSLNISANITEKMMLVQVFE